MNHDLKCPTAGLYPEWHQQPFQLNMAEMNNPVIVLEGFFEVYQLPEIRMLLKEWWSSYSHNKDRVATKWIKLNEWLHKLMEANWQLLQKDSLLFAGSSVQQKSCTIASAPEPRPHGTIKKLHYFDSLEKDPLEVIRSIFSASHNDQVKLLLKDWIGLALSSQANNEYTDSRANRKELIPFCEALQQVIEALFILVKKRFKSSEVGYYIPWELTVCSLSEEQKVNPDEVLLTFRDKYNWMYCRATIWELMDAVVGYRGPETIVYYRLMSDFEQLLCMAKAAFHYPLNQAE